MLNKLLQMIRRYEMLQPGDQLTCAVSGGADSMALLWAMYLMKEKLQISLTAAHFNHGLRGEESDRDEAFVRQFCQDYQISFISERTTVVAGRKGLEAAARDARYDFLKSLPGKIATAHTANDNAETLLMHLVRGTGLKGLGGIAPVNGKLIRPMLTVTRREVEDFLEQYHIGHVTDSSNGTDAFLRNRLRHHAIPLLEQENPRLAQNLSAMAMELREDESALCAPIQPGTMLQVGAVRDMLPAYRKRTIMAFLETVGVNEPEREHIALVEDLVFSTKPSAKASLPNGVVIGRHYDAVQVLRNQCDLMETVLPCPGQIRIPELGLQILCSIATEATKEKDCFTVKPIGTIVVRPRREGDTMRLPGGTKSLKKLFIDRKIPASRRYCIPVIADEKGVLGVYGIGANLDRIGTDVQICFQPLIEKREIQEESV